MRFLTLRVMSLAAVLAVGSYMAGALWGTALGSGASFAAGLAFGLLAKEPFRGEGD